MTHQPHDAGSAPRQPHQAAHPGHASSGLRRRWLTILMLAGLAIGGAGIVACVLAGWIPNPFSAATQKASAAEPTKAHHPTVKVIRPKRESSVPINIDQIATVEPYYRADLRARASGIVKMVYRDIGDKAKKGDVLVEIDVPESDQDVAKADAMIYQRRQELKVSEAKLKDAQAARDVSGATIKQREADVNAATATRDLKKRRFARFQELAAKGSVVGNVVEEEERDFLASEATLASAKANVERARADFVEAESKVEAAAADIELKKAQIIVGQRDYDRAKAIADYGKVCAPFDGVVVRRNVDPGSFVQNATTGSSEALISLVRVDIVSVSAKFPDSVAPHIALNTPAVVQIDDLPDVTIAASVTRLAPSVQNADRTMRVEIDLFNGSDEEYRLLAESLKGKGPGRSSKGVNDPLPVRAFAKDAPITRRLLPGMTGKVTLTIGRFGESYVLPSTAVYSRSGTTYLLLVQDGRTKQVPVRVQVNDGNTVRLALISKQQGSDGGNRDVLRELKGDEVVVAARQLEIGDGALVKSGPSDW